MNTKVCSKCGGRKTLINFSKDKKRKDGLFVQCKSCCSKYMQEYSQRLEVKKRINQYHQEYYQRPEIKMRNQQYFDDYELRNEKKLKSYRKKYYQDRCKNPDTKKALLKRQKEWRESLEGKNYMKLYGEKYRSIFDHKIKKRIHSHNRRAILKKLHGILTEQEWSHLLKLYNFTCPACGEKKELTMDHIVPVSKHKEFPEYVTNDAFNHQPLCLSCNDSKNKFRIIRYLPKDYFVKKIKLDFWNI